MVTSRAEREVRQWLDSHEDDEVVVATSASLRGIVLSAFKGISMKAAPMNTKLLLRFGRDSTTMSCQRIAKQLERNYLGPASAPKTRVLAHGVRFGGMIGSSVALFTAYEKAICILMGRRVSVELPPRPEVPMWMIAVAGACGGAAHAFVSTPLVLWQRGQSMRRPFGGLPITTFRDGVTYGVFFWSYAFSHRVVEKQNIPFVDMTENRWQYSSVVTSASCGGIAGFASHVSRFPLQTLYKRGRGWISQDLSLGLLCSRFVTTSGRQIASAALALGAFEAAMIYFKLRVHHT